MAKTNNLNLAIFLAAMLTAINLKGVTSVPAEYSAIRAEIIEEEKERQIGGNGSTLTPDERKVDAILLADKKAIIESARIHGTDFPPAQSFLLARKAMEATRGFRIIQKMPKGGVLHTHDQAMVSVDWLVKNVTYRDNCYMCLDNHSHMVTFHFYDKPPKDEACNWRTVASVREASGNAAQFDQSLHNNLSMVTSDPAGAYPDVNVVWRRFLRYFDMVTGLMLYAPVFEDYLWRALSEFRQDNVQYVEIRGLLPQVYELDGNLHNATRVLATYKRIIHSFVQKNPQHFSGGKFIKTSLRFLSPDKILADVKEAMAMYAEDPDFMVGFDLVAQEDPSHTLLDMAGPLLYPSQQSPPVHLPYFFHAGETDWQGTPSDYNLLDAILLNTTRIGHGYALVKHPRLMEMVRARDIAVEVNPISNQVLKLVDDLRNHPGAVLIAEGMPVVISSDDNAVWEALPLSHDFYVTFMALTPENSGLATLKQLAKNSLLYSAMSAEEKRTAIALWENKWNTFITDVMNDKGLLAPPTSTTAATTTAAPATTTAPAAAAGV